MHVHAVRNSRSNFIEKRGLFYEGILLSQFSCLSLGMIACDSECRSFMMDWLPLRAKSSSEELETDARSAARRSAS
jgi:hypothetical protein